MMLNKFKSIALAMVLFAISAVGVQASQSTNEPVDQLEKKIHKKIVNMPFYGVFDSIKFRVDDGQVTLSGFVRRGINKSTAENRIKKLDGVTSVVNNIQLLPPSSYDDRIRIATYRSLFNRGGLSQYLYSTRPSIRIIVNRGRVTLEGIVRNKSDVNLANISANVVPGVFKVTNNLVAGKQKY